MGRKSRVALSVALAALFLNVSVVGGSVSIATASQITPTDDSYVDASSPDRNFGTRTSMRVDGTPQRVAYLKFDIQGVGSPASAALQINMQSNGDDINVYAVADNSWNEADLTFNTAPAPGALLGTVDGVSAGTSYLIDVSAYITGDGIYSFAVTTTDNTALKIGTKEGSSAAQLHVPAPTGPDPFLITRSGTVYTAASQSNSSSYTGTLKHVVESAVAELGQFDGGTVTFAADTFNLGGDWFEFYDIEDIVFEGQGVASTVLVNNSSALTDTEVFDIVGANRITLRDMTISANGTPRTTSDALDFDNGNNITIERVHVIASRSRGIVFDGKGTGHTADGNTVIDCQIDGIPGDGIELLAASNNTISGCAITDVGGHGIQINKASSSAPQPNKKSNDNVIIGNVIDDSGQDGININSSDRNQILNNSVLNSSDNVSNRDGIRIFSSNTVTCDDNEVHDNIATDNQSVKTQRYGVNISSAECNRTVVGTNDLTGNKTGEFNDAGTDTQYTTPPDTDAPSVPTGVSATALSHFEVDVSWTGSTDNVGVDSYTIYRDGAFLQAVSGGTTSYIDSTVAPETSYAYTVEAFDAAGNGSGQSSPDAQVTTPPVAGTITVNPTHDAYVDSSRPDRNYGSSSAMRIDGSPEKNAYLMFDVSGVSGSISSATLRIYAASGSSTGFDVSGVANTSWTESGITFNTAPPIGSVLASSGSFSAGTFHEIDVTAYVTGNGSISFGVSTPASTAIRFDSSEGSNPPELVVILGP